MPESPENKAFSAVIELTGVTSGPLSDIHIRIPLGTVFAICGPSGIGKSLITRGILVRNSTRAYSPDLITRKLLRELSFPAVSFHAHTALPVSVDISDQAEQLLTHSTIGASLDLLRPIVTEMIYTGQPRCAVCGSLQQGVELDEALKQVRALLQEVPNGARYLSIGSWFSGLIFSQGQLCEAARILVAANNSRFIVSGAMERVDSDSELLSRLAQAQAESTFATQRGVLFAGGFGVVTRVAELTLAEEPNAVDEELRLARSAGGTFEFIAIVDHDRRIRHLIPLSLNLICPGCGHVGLPVSPLRRVDTAFDSCSTCCEPPRRETKNQTPVTGSCESCSATRLSADILSVEYDGHPVRTWLSMPIDELLERLVRSSPPSKEPRFRAAITVFRCLKLGRFALTKQLSELSVGERLKVTIAKWFFADVSELLFVIDDLDRYLHPLDLSNFREAADLLIEQGNSLLVTSSAVLPPELRIEQQWLAWEGGSRRRAQLSPAPPETSDSYPKRHLRQAQGKALSPDDGFVITLRNRHVIIPKNAVTVVIGRTGVGKSRLLKEIADRCAALSKKPGRSKTSSRRVVHSGDSISETGVPLARQETLCRVSGIDESLGGFFAQLPLARQRGLSPEHFVLANKVAQCPQCGGVGACEVFVESVGAMYESCARCLGDYFQPTVADIIYRGYNISRLYDLPAVELATLFGSHDEIARACDSLTTFGLDGIPLARRVSQLSQSDRQRLRLINFSRNRLKRDMLVLLEQPFDGLALLECSQLMDAVRSAELAVVATTLSADVVLCSDFVVALDENGSPNFIGDPRQVGVAYWREHHYSRPLPS